MGQIVGNSQFGYFTNIILSVETRIRTVETMLDASRMAVTGLASYQKVED